MLLAFADSIDRVFYLTTGLAAATFLAALGMGWHDIRQKSAVGGGGGGGGGDDKKEKGEV